MKDKTKFRIRTKTQTIIGSDVYRMGEFLKTPKGRIRTFSSQERAIDECVEMFSTNWKQSVEVLSSDTYFMSQEDLDALDYLKKKYTK